MADTVHSTLYITKVGDIYIDSNTAEMDRMGMNLGHYGDRAMEVMDDIQAAMMRGEIIFSMPPKPEWGC